MLKSVEGIYRDGKIELLEPVPPDARGKVIVTFLEPNAVDLAARDRPQPSRRSSSSARNSC